MAELTGINERAPVVGASEIELAATPEAVSPATHDHGRGMAWLQTREVLAQRGHGPSPTITARLAGEGSAIDIVAPVVAPRKWPLCR
jgi:hypothetical protein